MHDRPVASLCIATMALMASTSLAAVALTWLVAPGHEQRVQLVGAAWVGLAALSGAALVGALIADGPGDTRHMWYLASALTTWSLGAGLWFVGLRQVEVGPWTGPGDLVYLGAAILTAVAVLSHPDIETDRMRLGMAIDGTIEALSFTALFWVLVGQELAERSGDALGSLVAVTFAAATGVAVRVGMIVTVRRPRGSVTATTAATTAAGLVTLMAGNILRLTHRAFGESAATALFADAVVALGLAVVGAGFLHLRVVRSPRSVATGPAGIPRALAASHTGFALLAVVGVLADAAIQGRFDPVAAAVMTAVICSVLLRQTLVLADNRALAASLRATVDNLAAQATHDSLTGLPNRSGLDDRIAGAAAHAAATGTTAALYFVDLDHLKAVNDTLGHGAGDLMIRVTAERLTARFGGGITRFGGDEFVLVIQDLSSPRAAEQVARTIVNDTGQPVSLDGHRISASVSVGFVLIDTATTPEELLRRSDVALYRAKRMGRRCAAKYSERNDRGLHLELDIEPDLRRAVERGEMTLHYQPIVDLDTGAIVSVESLLRWRHPTRGLLGPDMFLEQAVSTGLLGSIGAASLRLACETFAAIPPEDLPSRPPSVAVNLSNSELTDRRVVERVAAALADSGLSPSRLTLEITEDVIVDDAVRATIDSLRELGVHLSIDDFGTGNSSLRQLGAYPADVLKIDRSFVDRLEDDPRAVAITTAIVQLAGDLGLTTVAEGVETPGQARILARIGCDRGQGWLFARAMPFEELVGWCAANCARGPYTDRWDNVASASSMMRSSSSATDGRSSIAPTT